VCCAAQKIHHRAEFEFELRAYSFWKIANLSPAALSPDLSDFPTSFWDSGSFEGAYMDFLFLFNFIGKWYWNA
jgi:hypothetical protein